MWLYKKWQNKEHKKDAALLIGINLLQQYHIRKYYREKWGNLALLRAQDEFFLV